MQRIKNIEKERKLSIGILIISMLIIIFTIFHARAISSTQSFEQYLANYYKLDYEHYLANVNFYRNSIIVYPIMLIIYTIYSYTKTSFGIIYKILNGFLTLLSLAIMQVQFTPHTIFARIVELLLIILFVIIMLSRKRIRKNWSKFLYISKERIWTSFYHQA